MIKTVVIDKNKNQRDILSKYLKNIDNLAVVALLDEFILEYLNLDEINLIIFDIGVKNKENILNQIKEIKEKHKNINFIALSSEINSSLVEDTMAQGIKDFLLKPVIPNILESAVSKISDKNELAKTICIFSNKGGIGKTSIAVNLAYEIENLTKEKVCLLDLSFNSEEATTFLNIEPKYNVDYIIQNIESSSKELLLSLIDTYPGTNLYVLSSRAEIEPAQRPLVKDINKIINSLKNIFSYIIIDTSSTLDEVSLSILNNSDLILLVALLNMPSIRNSQKLLEMFESIKIPQDKVKLIINRFIECEITLEDVEKTLSKEVFNKIPNNFLTLEDAINLGCPVSKTNPQSNIAKAYQKIALDITKINFSTLDKSQYNHGIFNLIHKIGE